MADKNRNRTNWSDKARRITGGVTLAIVILIIILCIVLGKKDKAVEPQITVPSASVETEVVVKELEKTPEPITVEPTVPVIDEPIKDIVEEAEPVAEPEPQYTSGEMVFDVCGITVENTWSEGTFISTSSEKDRFSPNDVMDFLRYEADKYQSYMDEVTVLKITASTGTIKIEYPPYMDPAVFMPYYKADIEEYAASIAHKDEVVIEEPTVIVEMPVVEETPVVIEETPVVEETVPSTADFSVFGYTVKNIWVPGTLTSVSETKGLLSEADVRGFVLYEIAKYGDLLVNNTSVEFIPDGFVLTYPEREDASLYIPTYKSDIEEYVNTLFAPVEEEAPVVVEETPVVEETVPSTADFSVFGYTVKNSWVPGTLTSVSETKGLLSEADVRGFVLYEIAKYGDLLVENTSVEFIPDGFVLTYPETEDASLYIPTYKSDIEEYVNTLFAPVEEAPAVAEEPVVEETLPSTADFSVFGYTVKNSWVPGTLTSVSETKGLLSEADVRGFVLYEIAKYGDLLVENTSVEFIPDGFVLTYPETEDASLYIPTYKSDIEEYVNTLFAPVEEAPVVEETPVVEEVVPSTADFSVFGYTVKNSWVPGTLTSVSETKGLLSEADVRGFVLYEIAKYGDLLLNNTSVEFIPDGFVLTYPETEDASLYIPTYKSDIEEYVNTLFAPVEEAPVVEKAPVVVEVPVVVEEAPVEVEVVKVPEPVSDIVVSVVTDEITIEIQNMESPVAEKVSTFDVSIALGADFGFKTGRSYNPTIFPTLGIAGEFKDMFVVGSLGIGTRFDANFIFRPLDGTFIGHEFSYFLNNNNWAVDGTLDAKFMFSLGWEKARVYMGFGVGYSLASNITGITSHTGSQVLGFNSAVVATGVVGAQWKLGDSFFLSLEGQGRYFFQTKEYNAAVALRMGWNF